MYGAPSPVGTGSAPKPSTAYGFIGRLNTCRPRNTPDAPATARPRQNRATEHMQRRDSVTSFRRPRMTSGLRGTAALMLGIGLLAHGVADAQQAAPRAE